MTSGLQFLACLKTRDSSLKTKQGFNHFAQNSFAMVFCLKISRF